MPRKNEQFGKRVGMVLLFCSTLISSSCMFRRSRNGVTYYGNANLNTSCYTQFIGMDLRLEPMLPTSLRYPIGFFRRKETFLSHKYITVVGKAFLGNLWQHLLITKSIYSSSFFVLIGMA
ncbi:MAG: hypothetical protein R2778_18455 [Saprospiraceae bacterium]